MKIKLFSLIALLALASTIARADEPPPFDDNGPEGQSPEGIPVDGGASLLAAAGVAYGLKRLRKAKEEAAQPAE